MDSARNVAESLAQDSVPAITVTPPSSAAPTTPTNSGLQGAAQLQAGAAVTDTLASSAATAAGTELFTVADNTLSLATGENTAGETLASSVAATDAPGTSPRAATSVLDTEKTQVDADAPHTNVLASSHSAAEDDAGDTAGDDATSAAERYWIQCHVTEEQLDAMAKEGLIPPKEEGG